MTSESAHAVQIAVNAVTHPKHLHCPKCKAVVFNRQRNAAEASVVEGTHGHV